MHPLNNTTTLKFVRTRNIDFILYFRELYDKQPNIETALLLGDAYMSIQEVCFVVSF